METEEMMLKRASRERRVILTHDFSPQEGKLLRDVVGDLKLKYVGTGLQHYILFQPHPWLGDEIVASVEVSSGTEGKYTLKVYDLDVFDRDDYILNNLFAKIGRIFNHFGIDLSKILKAEQVWK